MNKKKGFIFVETIIVTAILLASLMVIYSLFTSSYSQENKKIKYDDESKRYKVNYLKRFFQAFNLEEIKARDINSNLFFNVNCVGDAMTSNDRSMCDAMLANLHVKQILITTHNLDSILSNCDPESGVSPSAKASIICANNSLLNYMKSLDVDNTSSYFFIVEFAETEDGEKCEENDPCFTSYAYVPVD